VPQACPASAAPCATGTGLPWDVPVSDAVAAIAAARAECGDTFAVHSGDDRYLFTFSPTGVESFYGLPEEKASKGLADYLMLRRKLPDDMFDGRRILPSTLFRRDDVAGYLVNLDWALQQTTAELGAAGSVEVFDLTRRLGHRMGLASWAGAGSAHGDAFEHLVRGFDILDGSDAFMHPDAMAAVAASNKRTEKAALHQIAEIVAAAVQPGGGAGRWRHRSTPPRWSVKTKSSRPLPTINEPPERRLVSEPTFSVSQRMPQNFCVTSTLDPRTTAGCRPCSWRW